MSHADESIFILIEEEEIEAVEALINSGKVDVNELDEVSTKLDSSGWNIVGNGFAHANTNFPLEWICSRYMSHLFRASLQICQDGYSPLILATSMGLHDITEVLLEAKANIDYVAEACIVVFGAGVSKVTCLFLTYM